MADQRARITYQDYLQLPEGERYEVLEGELLVVPAPGWGHQRVIAKLYKALESVVESQGLGQVGFAPLDVILADAVVVQPDVLVILKEHLSIIKPEGVWGAPDMVVEVLSPSTAHRDRGVKRGLYGRYGVQEFWLVDPQERRVEVTRQRDGLLETVGLFAAGDSLNSPLFPGLILAVDDLFTNE